MIPAITNERREQLVNAMWGGVAVAWTVVVCAVALSVIVATVVGYVAIGRWVGGMN